MKKVEFINEKEIMNTLKKGRVVDGRLALTKTEDGHDCIEFVAYKHNSYQKRKDKLICELEHGWVKESAQRIKVFDSLPKRLGTARIMSVLDRELKTAKEGLMLNELNID